MQLVSLIAPLQDDLGGVVIDSRMARHIIVQERCLRRLVFQGRDKLKGPAQQSSRKTSASLDNEGPQRVEGHSMLKMSSSARVGKHDASEIL